MKKKSAFFLICFCIKIFIFEYNLTASSYYHGNKYSTKKKYIDIRQKFNNITFQTNKISDSKIRRDIQVIIHKIPEDIHLQKILFTKNSEKKSLIRFIESDSIKCVATYSGSENNFIIFINSKFFADCVMEKRSAIIIHMLLHRHYLNLNNQNTSHELMVKNNFQLIKNSLHTIHNYLDESEINALSLAGFGDTDYFNSINLKVKEMYYYINKNFEHETF